MEDFEKDHKYLKAKEKVAEIRKFYTGLMSYLVFITFLGAINYYTDEWNHPWFLWAALGWGIGIVFQAAKAFDWTPWANKDWEERKIKEFMDKEERNKSSFGRWE